MTVVTKETLIACAMLLGEEKNLVMCRDCNGTAQAILWSGQKTSCAHCVFGYEYIPKGTLAAMEAIWSEKENERQYPRA